MTVEAGWDSHGEATIDGCGYGEGRTSDRDEGSVDSGGASCGHEGVAGCEKGDDAAGLDRHGSRWVDHQRWEGLDWQGNVGGRARGDEGSSQGVDLVVGQRGIEWLGEGRLLQGGTDIGRVTSLDSEDGAGCGEVGLAHDIGGSAKIGGNTYAFQNGGGSHKHVHRSDTEGVRALSNRHGASSFGSVSKLPMRSLGRLCDSPVRAFVRKLTWVVSSLETSIKFA